MVHDAAVLAHRQGFAGRGTPQKALRAATLDAERRFGLECGAHPFPDRFGLVGHSSRVPVR